MKSFLVSLGLSLLTCCQLFGQADLLKLPAAGWSVVGDVSIPLARPSAPVVTSGEGILAHVPTRKGKIEPLQSSASYGNVELEFRYLLGAGSEATLYLHGNYPVTLSDDGHPSVPTARSNGGTPGYAPRQSVGRAPGLWQHLKVVFNAPNAGGDGAPARIVRAELNGVTIHENIQLPAPSSGAALPSVAPFRIEAGRGAVAIRDIKATALTELPGPVNTGNADPILVTAETNRTLRSFMDIPGSPRITHAISAGHAQQLHYTYDLDKGNLFQVWRGGFLDATPMWHERGNGTSRPLGSPIRFGVPELTVAILGSPDAPWPSDTTGSGFRSNGYRTDASDLPTFRYQVYGGQVEDAIRPLPQGTGFSRTIACSGAPAGTYIRLAAASLITDQGKGVYVIGDNAWYLTLEETSGARPIIRDGQGGRELLIPAGSTVRYSIIF